jgi:restriction system protein
MGRRRDGLSALMSAAAKLPWRLSLALVPITFTALHIVSVNTTQTAPVTNLDQMGLVVLRGYIHTFSTILQFIIPLVFLMGASVSLVKRSRSTKLFEEVRGDSPTRVANLSWQQFEVLIGEGFRRRGFVVTERGGAGPDGGVDLALARGHERFLVQCKHWRAQQVGVSIIRELYGIMAAERVAGGYVVTSGAFTKDAKEFAAGRNIELLGGREVEKIIREGRASWVKPVDVMPESGLVRPKPPVCPACKTPMVLRTAKRGSGKGSHFWGCAQFPRCRQTLDRG